MDMKDKKKQEHFKGSARALWMFIIHFQSKGVGFCTHHYGIGMTSVENEQQWQSHKQTLESWSPFLGSK